VAAIVRGTRRDTVSQELCVPSGWCIPRSPSHSCQTDKPCTYAAIRQVGHGLELCNIGRGGTRQDNNEAA